MKLNLGGDSPDHLDRWEKFREMCGRHPDLRKSGRTKKGNGPSCHRDGDLLTVKSISLAAYLKGARGRR